jgi:hypothetical protein
VATVMGTPVVLLRVSWKAPGWAVLVTRNSSCGGLKKVIRLEVSAEEETVTSLAKSERPGDREGAAAHAGPLLGGAALRLRVAGGRGVARGPATR